MFKIKSKSFNNGILESITFVHSFESFFEFTLDKDILVNEDFQKNEAEYNFKYNDFDYHMLILYTTTSEISNYDKEYVEKKYLSNKEVIISFFEFCDDSIYESNDSSRFLAIISLKLEESLSITKFGNIKSKTTKYSSLGSEYYIRSKNFDNNFKKQESRTFRYIGLGSSENDNIKVYIKDLNNNIFDGIIKVDEIEISSKIKYSFFYSKILIENEPVYIIISEIEFIFYLLQVDHLLLNINSQKEKIDIFFSNTYNNFQFLPNNLFASFFGESLNSICNYRWKIKPDIVLKNKIIKYSDYQGRKVKAYFEEMKLLNGLSYERDEERHYYESDSWNFEDEDTKQDIDFERWLNETPNKEEEKMEMNYEKERLRKQFMERKNQLIECNIKLDEFVLFFRFVIPDGKGKYIQTNSLVENVLIELTLIIPADYQTSQYHKIQRIYLNKFDNFTYLGFLKPNLFVFTYNFDGAIYFLNECFQTELNVINNISSVDCKIFIGKLSNKL